MKKYLLKSCLLVVLALAPWACNRPFPISNPISPFPIMTPTPSPAVITTPVCGFTTYNLGTISLQAGPTVIRSLADWQTFNSYPTGIIYPTPGTTPVIPPPPVNFTTQMLIVLITPVCATSSLVVNNICEGPNQITISATNTQGCVFCNVAATWGYASALAVPQCGLPIVWNTTQLPCLWPPTPTATP
jgi:hypothetical protein